MEITGKKPLAGYERFVNHIEQNKRTETSQAKKNKAAFEGDKVELSPQAKQIQEAKKLIKGIPEVRQSKIDAIKQQIENGTYKVDGNKIAVNLLRESLIKEDV